MAKHFRRVISRSPLDSAPITGPNADATCPGAHQRLDGGNANATCSGHTGTGRFPQQPAILAADDLEPAVRNAADMRTRPESCTKKACNAYMGRGRPFFEAKAGKLLANLRPSRSTLGRAPPNNVIAERIICGAAMRICNEYGHIARHRGKMEMGQTTTLHERALEPNWLRPQLLRIDLRIVLGQTVGADAPSSLLKLC